MAQCRLCYKRVCPAGFNQYCIECTRSVVINATHDQPHLCCSAECEKYPIAAVYKKFSWLPVDYSVYHITSDGKVSFTGHCIRCASREMVIQSCLASARHEEHMAKRKREQLEQDLDSLRPPKLQRFERDPVPAYLPPTDISDSDVDIDYDW
jgi:hypothetical protein